MPLDRVDVYAPSIHAMAALAVRSHLPPMEIRVAISALMTNVSEHFFYMA